MSSAASSSSATASSSTKQKKVAPVALRIPAAANDLLTRARDLKRVRDEEPVAEASSSSQQQQSASDSWSKKVKPPTEAELKAQQAKKAKLEEQVKALNIQDEDEEKKDESASSSEPSKECKSALNLFFLGMVRGVPGSTLQEYMRDAWNANPELTLQILQQARDAREGKGEKQVVLECLIWLRQHKPRTYMHNLIEFLRLGYFKDLLKIAAHVKDKNLPLLSVSNTVPLEIELLSEFLREDQEALKKWNEKKRLREEKLKAGAKDVEMEDGELVEMEDVPKVAVAPVTAASSSSSSSSTATPMEAAGGFELLVAPKSKADLLANKSVVVPSVLRIDLCFCIDSTGSMGPWLEKVKVSVKQIVEQMTKESKTAGASEVKFRLALCAYQDYNHGSTQHPYDLMDFTEDVEKYLALVQTLSPRGGDDLPEDMIGALQKSLAFKWDERKDTVKLLILIADAPCHGKDYSSDDSAESTQHLAKYPEFPDRVVEEIRRRNINFSFTRITRWTDRMLEKFQGWFDDRVTRKVMNVMQLGQKVQKFLPAVMEQLTMTALGRMPTIACEEEEVKEEDPSASSSSSATNADAAKKTKKVASCPLSLAAKWTPTENSSFDKKQYKFASGLAKLLFPDSKCPDRDYRKMCSALREELHVVERYMCTQQWASIDFATVPAKAHKLLKKAFTKHEATRYATFLNRVKKGEVKMKTTGLQPHELTETYRLMSHPLKADETTELQWKELVAKLKKEVGDTRHTNALAIVDTSGSMTWNMSLQDGYGGRGAVQPTNVMDKTAPIDVAISLSLLICEMTKGPFKDRVLTFSEQPKWVVLPSAEKATLCERVDSLYSQAESGGTTNLATTLRLILDVATASKCAQSDLPSIVFILSDMDLDSCLGQKKLNLKHLGEEFGKAGFCMPEIVMWNLSGRAASLAKPAASAVPAKPASIESSMIPGVEMSDTGIALLSGYSSSLLKLALKQELRLEPMAILVSAVAPYQNVIIEEEER